MTAAADLEEPRYMASSWWEKPFLLSLEGQVQASLLYAEGAV